MWTGYLYSFTVIRIAWPVKSYHSYGYEPTRPELMDSEIIRAVQKDKRTKKDKRDELPNSNIAEDDLYKEVITPLKAEFSDPIVAPHWWKKPADNFKGFAEKTRINNTIWRQWYVHFVKGKETVVKFANPMPLADKYHARVLAVVVEGHYWCRKHTAIRAQYNNWRHSRKPLKPMIKIDNLVVKDSHKQQEEVDISSPGVDDLVLSGMLNGFSDLEALDLSVQFDLPDFFGNCDNLINFDTPAWVDKVPVTESVSSANGYHPPTPVLYPLTGPPQVTSSSEDQIDTTSLNTLATAANMSEYYQSGSQQPQYPYRPPDPGYRPPYPQQPYMGQERPYNGVDTQQSACRQFSEQPPSVTPSVMNMEQNSDYNMTTTLANPSLPLQTTHQTMYMNPNMPVPKGPAYYPPTRLQYCYSDKTSYSGPIEQGSHHPPQPPVTFSNLQPYPEQQQQQQPLQASGYKQKLSEIEIDRKRRRAMKDRLQNLKQVLPPAPVGTKHTHAAILNTAAEYLRKEEASLDTLETEIVRLNSLISQTKDRIISQQAQIPENGISSACYGSSIVETQYAEFLEQQVSLNPLMKLYSSMLEPLFLSFNSMVDNTSLDSFCKTAHQWFAQNCSLMKLRELATNLVTSPNLEFEGSGG